MDLHARLDAALPSVRADLEDLVRIPSVSAQAAHADDVRRSAEATARLLEAEGLSTEILTVEGGAPANGWGGHILMIASGAAFTSLPYNAMYSASKAGAVALWTSLGWELDVVHKARGVRNRCVSSLPCVLTC